MTNPSGQRCAARERGRKSRRCDARLLRRPGEQYKVAVRVLHDEVLSAPRLVLERLRERHARCLKFQKELLDVLGGGNRDRGGQQALAVVQVGIDQRSIDVTQIEPRGVALHLAIERRLAIREDDREAELAGEELARSPDVGDEELRLGRGEDRAGRGLGCWAGHVRDSGFERLPAFNKKTPAPRTGPARLRVHVKPLITRAGSPSAGPTAGSRNPSRADSHSRNRPVPPSTRGASRNPTGRNATPADSHVALASPARLRSPAALA